MRTRRGPVGRERDGLVGGKVQSVKGKGDGVESQAVTGKVGRK